MAELLVARVAHLRAEAHVEVVAVAVMMSVQKEVVVEVVAQRKVDVVERSRVARRIQAIGVSSSRTTTILN